MLELEARQPIIKTPLHLVWHPNRISDKDRFWLKERRKRVRGSKNIAWIDKSSARVHGTKSWEWLSVYLVQWDDVYLPRGLRNIYCLSLSPSPLFLNLCKYIYRESQIIHAIVWCSESCDCNKHQYDRWNALWIWNPKNYWCENMTPSLPQTSAGFSSSVIGLSQ